MKMAMACCRFHVYAAFADVRDMYDGCLHTTVPLLRVVSTVCTAVLLSQSWEFKKLMKISGFDFPEATIEGTIPSQVESTLKLLVGVWQAY